MSTAFYTGCPVSRTFMDRWRSRNQIGPARPVGEVFIRRGRMIHGFHDDWPNPQFGRVYGYPIHHQWYPDWTPLDDWTPLTGVASIDLDQNFSNNGITTATIDCDNVRWTQALGTAGAYRKRERGYLWPWHGYVPPRRPGSQQSPNEWYMRLPNAQILVKQGYGPDTLVKTFTGLVDKLGVSGRPDRMTLTCRDFGGVLTDSFVFGWNKQRNVNDPITFLPAGHPNLARAAREQAKTGHRWIIIHDACDIVRVALRYCGFKQWQIEDSGVNLQVPYTVDKTNTWMDVVNNIATSLGFQFFIAEPDQANDLSIGIPIFRRPTVLTPPRSRPIMLSSRGTLTDFKPQHENANERYIIRVRGTLNRKVGRTLGGDSFKRVTFNYWPPWIPRMSGIIKQLTYYNIGSQGVLGLQTIQQCAVAAVLIAVQIALTLDTGTGQTPGLPAIGLDSFAYVTDEASGVNSRLYVTNRKSTMKLGGDGTGQGSASSNTDLLWATELGGALCDNPNWAQLVKHYDRALSNDLGFSWDHGFA